jgi:hypothetical protein
VVLAPIVIREVVFMTCWVIYGNGLTQALSGQMVFPRLTSEAEVTTAQSQYHATDQRLAHIRPHFKGLSVLGVVQRPFNREVRAFF